MEDVERTSLVSQWWHALTTAGAVPEPTPGARQALGDLVDELADGLDADPFDDAAGARVGAALVAAGLVHPAVPGATAPVLYRLSAESPRFDTDERVTALLIAIERGYHQALPREQRPPPETPEQSRPFRHISDKLFRTAVENFPIAIALGDVDGNLIYANQAMSDMLGVPVEALHRISIAEFAHPEEWDEINAQVFGRLLLERQGTVRMERRLIRGDGSIRWTSFSVTFIPASGDRPDFGLAVAEDVTQRHQLQEQLHWQARHDQLTGLPNRRLLLERIDAITANAAPDDRIGLCFADLDRFKDINDRYGHSTGDQVLVAIADRFRDISPDGEWLTARLGGDEFVVLVSPPTDEHRIATVTDQLKSALATEIIVGDHRLSMSVSIGAVTIPIAAQPAATLLIAADRELYRAKTDRGNRRAANPRDTDEGRAI
ncbi:diguanylate cyclase domain-containing protein [Nocardia vaccinii]|uniref:diguanylate cyclase domain-containing protein n=1 Tax=Nocardia vaccinii TaxID=1822 RepID=UPI0008379565|nr:diguanylate cyclase [Nocardia vaccinii]